ncbi:pre-mRNA-processing protein 40C isoform X2 [Elaeis guineensis]|uniref:pre-mRNA-processing protein 40C isoform X2 n=1 Tax=Elaeis guineensis var. tenera TaxID=51953 RepID=UPI003C6D167C
MWFQMLMLARQLATNQANLQGGRFAPPTTAASLQPPVPRPSICPGANVPGAITPSCPAPMQLPLSIPTGTSDAVVTEAGTSITTSIDSQSAQLSATVPSSSSTASGINPNANSSGILMPSTPSFTGHPGMPGLAGTPGLPGIPNSATVSSTVTSQPAGTNPSPLRPMVPPPVSLPPTSTPVPVQQNIQQQFYQPYPSLPGTIPPPQALWLHPPQAGGLQRAPFLPYSGVLPAPFQLPVHGMPPPAIPLPSIQPPGVPTVANQGPASTTMGSSQSGSNVGIESPSVGIDHEKHANDPHKDGESTKNEEADAWTAHKTESGVVYYYNSVTGESTYERPSSFNGEPENVTAQSTPVSWEKLAGTNWTLVTTNDGRKYYYDTKNKVSSWQVPAEVLELRKSQESDALKGNANQLTNVADKGSAPISMSAPAVETGGRDSMALRTSGAAVSSSALDLVKKKLQDAGTPVTSSPVPTPGPVASDLNGSKAVETAPKGQQGTNSKDKVKDDGNMSDSSSDSDDEESGPTKEECISQFKEMLKERGVAPFSKWEKELPKIVFDPRFKAVPSYSARKTIFEHFVRTRVEEERKEKRAAQKAAIDAFKQLLEEASEEIDHKTDYQTFKRKWGSDPRFGVLDRKERELLLNEKVKAAEEKMQAIRMAAVTSFKSMLRDNKDITTTSRWSRVKENLRNDPRYKAVKHEERVTLFNEYISELKAVEEEAERSARAKRDEQEKLKEREREMRKRKEREEQEMERVRLKVRRKEAVASYQALLVETIKDPKASWTESKPKLEKDPQGRATNPDLGQGDAEKLFRDHVKDLYERCARGFRLLLSEVITAEAAAQTTDDGKTILNSWSEAKRLLKPDPRYSKMPGKDREYLWRRYAEDMMRKQKPASDPKEKPDTDGRNRTSSDFSRRSPRRSHGRG